MSDPKTQTEFLRGLPLPWLAGNPVGQANAGALGQVLDSAIDQLRQSVKAHKPSLGPVDALPYMGGDCKLVQGPGESDANFRIRIQYKWEAWARAGTWLELLVQLYWGGFGGAFIVQQNGLATYLTGTPVAGQDPTPLFGQVPTAALLSALTSTVAPYRTIPAGTPWFYFDGNTDLCNRFAVIFPSSSLPVSGTTGGVATFTGAEDGSAAHPWPTVTWNNSFVDTTYKIQPGAVTITDGMGPIVVSADIKTKTLTGVQVMASASFVGSVDVLAWQTGANPYLDLHPADIARLQSLIMTWKPNAICAGITAIVSGETWDYPIGVTWDGDSNTWDQGNSVVQIQGSF